MLSEEKKNQHNYCIDNRANNKRCKNFEQTNDPTNTRIEPRLTKEL